MTRWAMITGEYPPQPGGVSDYVQVVAEALVAAGDEVLVVAPPLEVRAQAPAADAKLRVHRLPDRFGRQSRNEASRLMKEFAIDRILVQYVPHAFGRKAMNLPFANWVKNDLTRQVPIWIMFHEVAYPFSWTSLSGLILGTVTGRMAKSLASGAERIFASTPSWRPMIRQACPTSVPVEWLPIPSLIPITTSDEGTLERLRLRLLAGSRKLIGHFGTFPTHVAKLLSETLARVLAADAETAIVLFGRGSNEFHERFDSDHRQFQGRLTALGGLPAGDVAIHMAACDLMLQPFGDGISSRRSSVMPALAQGKAVVTNIGALSESIWQEGGVAAAAIPTADSIASVCLELLADDARRIKVGEEGRRLYESTFALPRTINALRGTR
jgi:glycosyltransferase involved in cell wall biosynthesis